MGGGGTANQTNNNPSRDYSQDSAPASIFNCASQLPSARERGRVTEAYPGTRDKPERGTQVGKRRQSKNHYQDTRRMQSPPAAALCRS